MGASTNTSRILEELRFKGLVTIPYGIAPTPTTIKKAFQNNKSVACAADDYFVTFNRSIDLPNSTFIINSNTCCKKSDGIINVSNGNIASQFASIATSLDCDIGDHKSNSSGLKGAPTVADCAYCKYLAGFSTSNERTVYKSESFFVIPTVGEFITGYLLIIPYNHIMSNAELDSKTIAEFKTVLEDVEYLLKLTYNATSFLVWENGSGNGGIGKTKDSIVHSHVHICPSSYTSEKIMELSGFPFETLTLEELEKYQEHSYLLLRTPDYNIWKINNNPELYIPRQYIRQLVAEEYGIPGEGWNWCTHPFSEKMYQTVEDIRAALKANWDIIPTRIKNNTRFLL